ncbi:MAG: amidohydrolase [Chloroflexi bacterium]|nr:amidohydrolase [Chloroflexota bacterium]MBM4451338.1 amidohydrolase [Chloroflexota bacterium]MBM4454518.1 amidohydrolase [Chloroflexota bacterium]
MTREPEIIDVWMQHPNLKFINHPMFDSLKRWTGQEKLTSELPIELTIAAMDEAHVSLGLICAWWGPQGPLISNDEVAAHVKKYPKRFVGIASADLYKPMEGVRELRRCVRQLGFKGLRIVQWLWNLPPTDRRYYPLYAECIELGIPVCLQVGHTGPLCPSEPGRPIPYIDEVALEFPELKIVGGHIGYPWTVEMIAVATKHLNVYIDTSAYTAKRFPKELVDYMKTNGKKKVMFGTNYPMITPAKCLKDLNMLELDEETRKLFLYQNAQRVFELK